MIAAIEAALQHDVAGDPITGIRWTRRTTEKIATELATLDIQVCPRTVARILKDLDYRLRVNHKRISATLHTRLVDPYHLTVTVCHYPAAPRPSSVDLEHRLGDEGTRANGARPCYGRSRRLPQQGRCCSTRTNSSTVMNKMVAFS